MKEEVCFSEVTVIGSSRETSKEARQETAERVEQRQVNMVQAMPPQALCWNVWSVLEFHAESSHHPAS